MSITNLISSHLPLRHMQADTHLSPDLQEKNRPSGNAMNVHKLLNYMISHWWNKKT